MKMDLFVTFASLVSLSGCGLTTTVGPTWVGTRDHELLLSASVRTHAQREPMPVVGFGLNGHPNDGLELDSGVLHVGYDFILVPGLLLLEPGADFGAGQPAVQVFEGKGAYSGGTIGLRLRPTPGERTPGFNIAFPIVELTVGGHFGVWMPPESAASERVFADRGLDFGLRFALGSDLISPNQGHIWRGNVEGEGANGPGSKEDP